MKKMLIFWASFVAALCGSFTARSGMALDAVSEPGLATPAAIARVASEGRTAEYR